MFLILRNAPTHRGVLYSSQPGCASTEHVPITQVVSSLRPPAPPFDPSPLGKSLRHLFLAGNPICLLPAYRERILSGSCGPNLIVLDSLPVSAAQCGPATAAQAAVDGGQAPFFDRTAVPQGREGRNLCEPLDAIHFGIKV